MPFRCIFFFVIRVYTMITVWCVFGRYCYCYVAAVSSIADRDFEPWSYARNRCKSFVTSFKVLNLTHNILNLTQFTIRGSCVEVNPPKLSFASVITVERNSKLTLPEAVNCSLILENEMITTWVVKITHAGSYQR